ncbi:MAG TPA: hypothetical protein VN915_05960 [Elusimicrobiota bacterium]|nr:hypothetical protein [Elusimicrobiota bacterium]
MEELRIHQLTKEMVAEELRALGDPCAAAAAVVKKTLTAALQSAPEGTAKEMIVEDAVKGAMTALLLAEQSLARGGLMVLEVVLDVTAAANLDPTESMRAALRALADLRRFVDPARVDDVRLAIESKYMGAGEVFSEYLRAPRADLPSPPPRNRAPF